MRRPAAASATPTIAALANRMGIDECEAIDAGRRVRGVSVRRLAAHQPEARRKLGKARKGGKKRTGGG